MTFAPAATVASADFVKSAPRPRTDQPIAVLLATTDSETFKYPAASSTALTMRGGAISSSRGEFPRHPADPVVDVDARPLGIARERGLVRLAQHDLHELDC